MSHPIETVQQHLNQTWTARSDLPGACAVSVRPASEIDISPAALEAGVLALVEHYDADAEGLGNLRLTVRAILRAGFDTLNHGGIRSW